jgi:hypothetical protein
MSISLFSQVCIVHDTHNQLRLYHGCDGGYFEIGRSLWALVVVEKHQQGGNTTNDLVTCPVRISLTVTSRPYVLVVNLERNLKIILIFFVRYDKTPHIYLARAPLFSVDIWR